MVMTMNTAIDKDNDELLDFPVNAGNCAKVFSEGKKPKILMVSSCGGHWVQMNRLVGAFGQGQLYFACTDRSYAQAVKKGEFHYVPEASSNSRKVHILWQALRVAFLVARIRPDIVVSTGAAPGYFAILFAKKIGAKTIWVDSIANVDKISLAGRRAAKHTDLFLTQWEHLVQEGGPEFCGSVL